jgi:ankyrin repeat protein
MPPRCIRDALLLVLVPVAALGAGNGLPLVDAVRNGNREAVRALLKQRADVNLPEPDGMTALHWAVRANDTETAQLLIRAGANVKAANRYQITPLSLAATNGNPALVEMLLKTGADPNGSLPDGETVLMTAARTGNVPTVKILLAHGANPNAKESTQGQTALMSTAMENHVAAAQLLIEAGADVDARSVELNFPAFKWGVGGMVSTSLPKGGWTALMYAARQNARETARALADGGAELNLTDPEGTTALIVAIINAHFDLAGMLLEKGADPNIADLSGLAALYAAVDMHTLWPLLSRPSPKVTGDLDAPGLIKRLLAYGANPNATLKRPVLGKHHDSGDASLGDGATPFMRAAKAGDVTVMRLLREGGADPTLRQKNYTTALFMAAAGRTTEAYPTGPTTVPGASTIGAIELCLEAGVDINAFNANGQTALHAAAARGDDATVKFLAEGGAKLDTKDKRGNTPLDTALGIGRQVRNNQAPVVYETTAKLLRQLMSEASAEGGPPPR